MSSSALGGLRDRPDVQSTLVIGCGNPNRGDDGVAYVVVNALRSRLGQPRLMNEEEDGLDELVGSLDAVHVLQLGPELLDIAASYQQIVFVDARVQPDAGELSCIRVRPEYSASALTHHMTPALFLALLQALYQREPLGFVVSIRGTAFGFGQGLSGAAEASVAPAAECILALAGEGEPSDADDP